MLLRTVSQKWQKSCCCPRRGTSCYKFHAKMKKAYAVAVPRRGASCYAHIIINAAGGDLLLSPAGARVVTRSGTFNARAVHVSVPRRGASCYGHAVGRSVNRDIVAVPRRGASCYLLKERRMSMRESLLSPAGARAVTEDARIWLQSLTVAVPRRGASCYTNRFQIAMKFDPVAVPRRGASCYIPVRKSTQH